MPMRRISTGLTRVGFDQDPSPLTEGMLHAASTLGELWPRLKQIEMEKKQHQDSVDERKQRYEQESQDRAAAIAERKQERTDALENQKQNHADYVNSQSQQRSDAHAKWAAGFGLGPNASDDDVAAHIEEGNRYKRNMDAANNGVASDEGELWQKIASRSQEDQRLNQAIKQQQVDKSGSAAPRNWDSAWRQAKDEIGDPDGDTKIVMLMTPTGEKKPTPVKTPLSPQERQQRVDRLNSRALELTGHQFQPIPLPPETEPLPISAPAVDQQPQTTQLWPTGNPSATTPTAPAAPKIDPARFRDAITRANVALTAPQAVTPDDPHGAPVAMGMSQEQRTRLARVVAAAKAGDPDAAASILRWHEGQADTKQRDVQDAKSAEQKRASLRMIAPIGMGL